ncbi:MAG: hypothetical protein ACYDG2_13310 [Ruminiclostridium sp.]
MISLFASRIFQSLVIILMTKIMTAVLGPSEYTKVFLFISIVNFADLFFFNPVYMFFYRQLNKWISEGSLLSRLKLIMKYLVCMSIITGALVVLFNQILGLKFELKDYNLFLISMLYSISFIGNRFFTSILNLLEARGEFITISLTTSILIVFASYFLVLLKGETAQIWIIGQVIGYTIGLCIALVLLIRKSRNWHHIETKIQKINIKELLSFSGPLAISAGLFWVQMQSYRFILNHNVGLEVAAYFIAGYNVAAAVISSIELVLTQYLQPKFYKSINNNTTENQRQSWERYATFVFPITLLTFIYILFMAPYITRILLAPEFFTSYQYVIYGAAAETLRVFAAAIGMVAHATLKSIGLLKSNAVGAILTLGIGLFLIPYMGNLGAGITLALAGVGSLFFLLKSMRKLLTFDLPIKKTLKSLWIIVPLTIIILIIRFVNIKISFITSFFVCTVSGLIYLLFCYILVKDLMPRTSHNTIN